MLTRMRFKNWRSLKDVEIDNLTPITVFIGANSSGKTNIIDALSFLRRMLRENVPDSTYFQVNREAQIRTLGVPEDGPIEFELAFRPIESQDNLEYRLQLTASDREPHITEYLKTSANTEDLFTAVDGEVTQAKGRKFNIQATNPSFLLPWTALNSSPALSVFAPLQTFITSRMQILGEGFSPALRSPRNSRALYDTYLIDEVAQDLPIILSFMKEKFPELYVEFQEDLKWFMKHVTGVEIREEATETRIVVQEGDNDAPTVSAGTSRALAMFAAYHALSMRYREMSGLVVIEEPDTALNPGLLQKFVELLRNYRDSGYPRQFILTTHNPTFLNYFRPEEVRVVRRDEQGYTHVERVPEYVQDIWIDKTGHSLGDAWLTNSLGGFAQ